MHFDVVIIGAGVVGSLIARELSRLDIKIALLEKGNDMAVGATRANSAIVHTGFDAKPDSLKARLNVEGFALFPKICDLLHVPFKVNGHMVLAFNEEERETLCELYERGIKNGVQNMSIIDSEEIIKLECNVSHEAVAALLVPQGAIVCPYELTIAAVVNACDNGVSFFRNTEVTGIDCRDDLFYIKTASGEFCSKYIINAAGVNSAEISRMIGDDSFSIQARIGEYFVLDKNVGNTVKHTIFQCPSRMGKGILVTPSVDGNLLVGPSAFDVVDSEDTATTAEGLDSVREAARRSVPVVNTRDAITSFAGVRAHPDSEDFIIGSSEKNKNFIQVSGIESPGLSASPGIAKYVFNIFTDLAGDLPTNKNFNPERPEPVRFRHMTDEQRAEIIKKDSAYGKIICRCETVTEGEIIDAIRGQAGARDIDGVKRRTRAGMGRCQGGFCGSKVLEILCRELDLKPEEITKFGKGSDILFEKTK